MYKFDYLKRIAKILFVTTLVFGGSIWASYADRGLGKKKSQVKLNILTTNNNLKSSLVFNLNPGLQYTGTLVTPPKTSGSSTQLVTYQKGNSVYIMPYKQKAISTEVRQGYTGFKMVIKP